MSNYEYEPLGVELEMEKLLELKYLEMTEIELEHEMNHPKGGWLPHDYPELMEDT